MLAVPYSNQMPRDDGAPLHGEPGWSFCPEVNSSSLSSSSRQRVPGDHGLAVRFGEAGLHSAESAIADDHLRVRGPEPCQPQQLVRLAEGAGQPVPEQGDAKAAHGRPDCARMYPVVIPVTRRSQYLSTANSTAWSTTQ